MPRPPDDRLVVRRIIMIAAVLAFTIAFGTAGFIVVAHYPPFDAFYMTVITITTVGYRELYPLSFAGRIFNSVLVIGGVSAMFFTVGVITQTIIEMQLQDPVGKRRKKQALRKMKDHYIVCGFGRVGRNAAFELQRSGASFVVIDRDEQRVERAAQAGMHTLLADATRDETLREAGIERAQGFIAALATDAENVFVILSAKTLNPCLTVVTRASEEDAEQKLRRAGADTVFSPYSIAGLRLAQALVRPHVVQLLDFAGQEMGLDVAMEQLRVVKPVPAKLLDLLPASAGVIVLAIRRTDGRTVFNPRAGTDVFSGDILIVIGDQRSLRRMEQALLDPK